MISSREIAELIGKQHADDIRDIRKMLENWGGEVDSKFAGYYKASNGKQKPCFNLPRREADILLTRYSVELRAVVNDRQW
ncbi:Rha family transcriptional regulator [Pseudomonas reinekei]